MHGMRAVGDQGGVSPRLIALSTLLIGLSTLLIWRQRSFRDSNINLRPASASATMQMEAIKREEGAHFLSPPCQTLAGSQPRRQLLKTGLPVTNLRPHTIAPPPDSDAAV